MGKHCHYFQLEKFVHKSYALCVIINLGFVNLYHNFILILQYMAFPEIIKINFVFIHFKELPLFYGYGVLQLSF